MNGLIITAIAIFTISFVLSMFGRGGGSFRMPLLLTFLPLAFYTAAGISLFMVLTQGLSMAYVYYAKNRLLDWKLALILAVVAAGMAFAGGFASVGMSPVHLKILFAAVILISAYFLFINKKVPPKRGEFGVWHRDFSGGSYDVNILYLLPLIAAVAFVAGAVGISGSSLMIPACILLGGIPLRIAIGNSAVLVIASGGMGFLGHLLKGGIDWKLCLILGAVTIIGSQTGSRLHLHVNENRIRIGYVVLLVAAAAWMIVKIFL